MASLTSEQVARLRRKYRELRDGGWRTETFLKVQARNLGVHRQTVYSAVTGRTHQGVDEPPYDISQEG